MSDPAERIVIRHPDGRAYSVTRKAFAVLYEEEGFVEEGPETPEAFIADVPKPAAPKRRGRPRKPAQ